MRNLLSMPWWKRIVEGDTTAIPAEWRKEDGTLNLQGAEAVEFIKVLEENNVILSGELERACKAYITRSVINKTGKHPEGTDAEDWERLYTE